MTSPQFDKFDRARESVGVGTGAHRKVSTVMSDSTSFFPTSTWVIETLRNSETTVILVQSVSAEGGQRFVLPNKVAQAIYRQHDEIIKLAKKARAKAGAETRKIKKGGG